MALPMRSTDFRAVVEPVLNDIFDGVYDQRDDEFKQVFDIKPGQERAYQEDVVFYGFNAAPEMPEGTPVVYRQAGVLFQKRYVFKPYGLAFALTRVLVEDGDHIRIGSIFSRHLAQAMIETQETLTANVLNYGFNGAYPGGDGVALSANNHLIAGGTFSNILSVPAALSQTSVEQILIQIRQAVDNNGKKSRINAKRLIIGPQNMMQAEVIQNSVLRTGTTNNDINPVKSMGFLKADPVVLSRLTSPTAWWVQTDVDRGLRFLTRRKIERSMEGDFETDSMRYKSTMRFGTGWTDPRTVFGTAGV